jgi:hypothetical protein
MHVGVERDRLDDLGAVRLQGAAVVLDGNAGDPPDDPVRDDRRDLPRDQLVLPLVPPTADDVVPSAIFSRNFGMSAGSF